MSTVNDKEGNRSVDCMAEWDGCGCPGVSPTTAREIGEAGVKCILIVKTTGVCTASEVESLTCRPLPIHMEIGEKQSGYMMIQTEVIVILKLDIY